MNNADVIRSLLETMGATVTSVTDHTPDDGYITMVIRVPRYRVHPSVTSGLTPRQIEVAGLVAQGHSNDEIARILFISPVTAARHVHLVLKRLGYTSRAQVAAWAVKHLSIEIPDARPPAAPVHISSLRGKANKANKAGKAGRLRD